MVYDFVVTTGARGLRPTRHVSYGGHRLVSLGDVRGWLRTGAEHHSKGKTLPMAEGDFYTVDEAAKVLKFTSGRIRQMLRAGELERVALYSLDCRQDEFSETPRTRGQ